MVIPGEGLIAGERIPPERTKAPRVEPAPEALPYEFLHPPRHVGGYRVGGAHVFMATRKPALWHRWWARVLLGWTWENLS